MINWKQLPKAELHLHLDCSLSYKVVAQLDPSVTIEAYRQQFIAPPKCTNLADFLTRTPGGINLMQTKEQLRLVVLDLFEQLADDNVIYAEIRFAPLQHLHKGLTPFEVVEAVDRATAEGILRYGIEARIILCTLRHYSEAQSMETVKLVQRFRGTNIAGFDIAADEAGYPLEAHVKAFAFAQENGIPCTAHAGEAKGPESVWETLERLKPSRIGHGVRSIEDDRLVTHLVNEGIHLEICPTCNVQIDIFDTYLHHPVDRLYRKGVLLSINTDAKTITNITLSREYEKLHTTFGWTVRDFYTCNSNAIQAAFIPEELKAALAGRLYEGYTKYLME